MHALTSQAQVQPMEMEQGLFQNVTTIFWSVRTQAAMPMFRGGCEQVQSVDRQVAPAQTGSAILGGDGKLQHF